MDYDFALAWRSISMYQQDNLRHRPLSGRNLAGNCDQYCCGRLGGKSSFWIGPLWTVTKLRLGCFCSLNSRKILFQQQSGRVCGIVDAIEICGVVNKLQSRQLFEALVFRQLSSFPRSWRVFFRRASISLLVVLFESKEFFIRHACDNSKR